MDNNRGRLLYAALVIADASWMFALLATVGMIFGLGTSPLSWPVLAALLGLSIFVGWVAAGVRGDFVTISIQKDERWGFSRNTTHELRCGDDTGYFGILEHETLSLFGVGWIYRQVGATRLQYA